jgi:hypothetical protein
MTPTPTPKHPMPSRIPRAMNAFAEFVKWYGLNPAEVEEIVRLADIGSDSK